MTEGKSDIPAVRTWTVVVAAIIAIALWLWNGHYGLSLSTTERGVFGDMFGAVNALFSGLAFVGVVYAIVMQRHEITIAKREIAYTKTILDEQQKQLALQNSETKKQAFENTFFQMLRLFSDITSQIDLLRMSNNNPVYTKGKDVFPIFLDRLRLFYRNSRGEIIDGVDANGAYISFYNRHNSELGHYFRILYNIIKFIDASDVANKKLYSNIVRAQLSDAEAAILFHNGLSLYGIEKFKPLIEKYGLLKNVVDTDILDPTLKKQYQASAFGR